MKMDNTTKEAILEAAGSFVANNATLKELQGITNAELEAVYSLAFGYYQTGKYDEAGKLFQFLVLFDHLNPKFWLGMGAVQQVKKDYKGAITSYAYGSFLDLSNPKPQLHAAECYLALGDKANALSALEALDVYCAKDTDLGREYRAKAEKLRQLIQAA